MSDPNDEELARRLQRRDSTAIADLYDRFGKLVYSVIVAIVRDTQLAEDLVQESFLHAWNEAHAFEPGREALWPWLLAIARNRAIDHVRFRRPRFDPAAPPPELREHPSLFAGMEAEVLQADHSRIVRAAVAKLSPHEQKVLELAYYEGLSQAEMAERMGEAPAAIRTWLLSAVKQLRGELGQAVTA
ncbi:MAG TPA: sigma-70 family RNA polymerase sigma factor [Bryobacteraceae bacterium]|nr:sigma-70 family RNA polymerase sigma factor [Bryobacteraceae bacterium]